MISYQINDTDDVMLYKLLLFSMDFLYANVNLLKLKCYKLLFFSNDFSTDVYRYDLQTTITFKWFSTLIYVHHLVVPSKLLLFSNDFLL